MFRLRTGEWIAGAGAVALLAAMFLHWYAEGPAEATAWQAFGILDVVLVLLAMVPVALVVAQATRRSPSIPVALSVFTALAGALATLLILLRILDEPGPDDVVAVGRGAWLGCLAAAIVAVGGWRSLRTEAVPGTPMPPVEHMPTPAP